MTVTVTQPSINVREKLAELDKPSGVAGEAMLRAETPQEQFNLIGAGRRNLALNGNFTVSQRGDYSTATSFDTNDYFVDRWRADRNTVSGTVQRIAGGFDTGLNSIKAAATSSATGNIGFAQRWNQTERPQLYSDNQGDYVVFSGWLRSNSSKANWYIYNNGVFNPQQHSGSGEWEYMVCKVPTASLSSNIDFNVFLYDGSNVAITSGDYVEIALVQIEVNNTGVATPFEHRSYGEELAACQRYYEKWSGNKTMHPQYSSEASGAYAAAREIWSDFKVEKRANPAVTVSGTSSPTAVNASIYGLGAQSSVSSSTASVRLDAWTANAEL